MNFSDLIIDWTDTPKGDMTTSFTYSNSIYDVVVTHQTSNKNNSYTEIIFHHLDKHIYLKGSYPNINTTQVISFLSGIDVCTLILKTQEVYFTKGENSIKHQPLKYCPRCLSSLDKCDTHTTKGHEQHRFCKTCHWSNF